MFVWQSWLLLVHVPASARALCSTGGIRTGATIRSRVRSSLMWKARGPPLRGGVCLAELLLLVHAPASARAMCSTGGIRTGATIRSRVRSSLMWKARGPPLRGPCVWGAGATRRPGTLVGMVS